MALSESNMVEFKMAAIIKLSQKEWVKVIFCANGGNQSWQVWVSLRGKTKMAEPKITKFKMAEFKMAAIIIESEWMSLSQIELVWVRVLCKMAESKMAEFKMGDFKMAAIIKLIRLS